MMRVLKSMAKTLFITGLFASTATHAQVYLGAGAGQVWLDANCFGVTTCNNKSTSKKIFLGYDLSRTISIEGSHNSLGTIKGIHNNINISKIVQSTDLSILFSSGRTNQYSLFSRFGIAKNSVETSASYLNLNASKTVSSNSALFGAGVTYLITPNFQLRAEIDARYAQLFTGKSKLRNFNFSGQFSF